jgi:hypothetical protein
VACEVCLAAPTFCRAGAAGLRLMLRRSILNVVADGLLIGEVLLAAVRTLALYRARVQVSHPRLTDAV